MRSRLAVLLLLVPGAAGAHGVPPVSERILFVGDQMLVPTRGWGVFVGSDGGDWRWICDEAINRDPDRVWARSADGTFHVTDYLGVTSSRDGGCTWVAATSADLATRRPSTVVADPVDPKGAWTSTYGSLDKPWEALFHTTDDGLTWTPVLMADEDLRGVALSADGATIYVIGFSRRTDGGAPMPTLHVSRDRGATFTATPLGFTVDGQPPFDAVMREVDPADPSVAYFAAYAEPLHLLGRLDGYGARATEAFRVNADIGNVAFDPRWPAQRTIWVGTWAGLMRSVDGQSFAPAGDLHLAQCVAPHGGHLYACSWNFTPDEKAVARSDDGGDHFSRVFRYSDTLGPITSCPPSTPVATVCAASWEMYACQLGVACGGASDGGGGAPGATSGGCGGCAGGGGGGGTVKMSTALLVGALALLRLRRRRGAWRALPLAVAALLAGCDGPPATGACPNDLPAACPSPPPSWSRDVQPIVAAHCAVCHSPTGINPTRPFTTWQQVDGQRGDILSQVYACKMPPPDGGVAPPVGTERALLLGWLVCGAPDN
jgi:MYXO-CTERM domain-containing protein